MTPHTPPSEESPESNVLDASDSANESVPPERRARLRQLAPIITSATSAVVLVLAFLLPGAQDQWDRRQSRKLIDAYAELGRQLMTEQRYVEAEQAFATAFELSENCQLDLEQKRLVAHVRAAALAPDDTLVLGALITQLRKSGDTVSIAAAQLRRSEIRAIAGRRRASRDTTSHER